MRRRLRRQRQMREALLLDLGALVYELHRQGRREPELLQAKAAELTAVDEEVRALAEALGTDHSVMQLVATGVAGSCENCGSLMSVDQRYCSSCGASAVPALSTDGERPAMTEHTDEYAALSVGPDEDGEHEYEAGVYANEDEGADYEAEEYDSQEFEQLEEEAFEPGMPDEPPEEGVFRVTRMAQEEPEAVEPEEPEPEPEAVEPEPELDEPEPEPEAVEPEPEHDEPEPEPEAVEPEPELEEPAPEPEPELVEPEPVESEPEPVEDSAWEQSSDGEARVDGAATPAGRAHAAAPPPRAIADDALDSAGKAIRTGIERGRQWLRGRRDEP